MNLPRVAAVPLILASLTACGSGHRAAAPLGHRTAQPPTLNSVRSYLGNCASLVFQRLRKQAGVQVDAHRAETVALHLNKRAPAPKGVSATLVRATDSTYCTTVPYGHCRLIIDNRPVWLVLAPNQQVPIMYPMGKSGPPSYWATMATLVDARTGKYIEAAAVPTR